MKEEIENLLINDGSIEGYVKSKINEVHYSWIMIWAITILLFIGYACENHKNKCETIIKTETK